MTPSTSILITAFNVERYIGRAVRSALNQSVDSGSYEIIVVNDCSIDRTRFALEVFENDIRLINNETHLGLPASLNHCIRRAKGQFVVRIDGDDYVHRDFVKVLELHLRLNEHMDAVACDYLWVDDDEVVLGRGQVDREPIACGIMFRIEHLIDIGLYDEQFLCLEDEDLRLRFLKKYTIDRVKLPLYRYRRHKNNMTNNQQHLGYYRTLLEAKHRETG